VDVNSWRHDLLRCPLKAYTCYHSFSCNICYVFCCIITRLHGDGRARWWSWNTLMVSSCHPLWTPSLQQNSLVKWHVLWLDNSVHRSVSFTLCSHFSPGWHVSAIGSLNRSLNVLCFCQHFCFSHHFTKTYYVQQYHRQIHSLFTQQTQTGCHLVSIQPGLT